MITKKRTFVYQDRDDSLLKKRMEFGKFSGNSIFKSGFTVFKPKVSADAKATSTNKIRILPPTWSNPQHYGYEVWVHYKIGDEKNMSSFICNKLMGVGECPICEQIARHKTDKEYVDKIKPVRKIIIWLVDREDEEAGPKLWTLSVSLDRNLAFQANDEDSGRVLKIDHPEKGYDIAFETRKGDKKGIPYTYEGERIARTEKPIFSDSSKTQKVLDYIMEHPVTEVLNFKDYDYIKGVFEGKTQPVVSLPDEEEEEERENEVEVTEEELSTVIETIGLENISREELEDIAVDELGLKNREIRALDTEDLRNLINEKYNKSVKHTEVDPNEGMSSIDLARKRIESLKSR